MRRASSSIHGVEISHLVLNAGIEMNILYAWEVISVDADERTVDDSSGLMEEETGTGAEQLRESDAEGLHLRIEADAPHPKREDVCSHKVVRDIFGSLDCYFNAEYENHSLLVLGIDSGAARTLLGMDQRNPYVNTVRKRPDAFKGAESLFQVWANGFDVHPCILRFYRAA